MRSKPRRTYDPARVSHDPEGDFVPMFLADMDLREPDGWSRLQSALEHFGRNSGLFHQIRVRRFGDRASEPFQLQISKSDDEEGPWYNLMDVGYGVSQVLPLTTELLRDDAPALVLLQQPEVHLHPSAQAALGSLFCSLAQEKQIVIETHSDHLIDRIRMDVRDRVGAIMPEHVSILYFERDELDVKIPLDQVGRGG